MRKLLLSTAATMFAFGLLASPSFAQASRPTQADLLRRYDTDGDGVLSDAEKAAARADRAGKKGNKGKKPMSRAEMLRRYDTDGDGVLSDAEKAVAAADRKAAADKRIDDFFARVDKDNDGKLSKNEIKKTGPRARMIARADADKDGFVTKDELKAHIAQMAQRAKNGKGKPGKGRPGKGKGRPGGRPGPGGRRPGGRGPGGAGGSGSGNPAPPPQSP